MPVKMCDSQLDDEAAMLVNYLVNKPALQEVVNLYVAALSHHPVDLTCRQKKIWQFCLTNKWSLPLIDAALAWSDKHNLLRKKIYIMLAILETQPAYNEYFLPRRRSVAFILVVFFQLIIGGLRCIAGKILLWFI